MLISITEYYKRYTGPERMNPFDESVKKYKTINVFERVVPTDVRAIERQEIDYMDRSYIILNRWSPVFMTKRENNGAYPRRPYLLFDQTTRFTVTIDPKLFLDESQKTVDQHTIISQLTNPDMIPEIDWLNTISKLTETVEREVVINFPLANWQIGEDGSMTGFSNIWVKVPGINKNVEVITTVMEYYGYFLSNEEPWAAREGWKILNFEANVAPKISEKVLKRIKKMYHVSPTINKKSILAHGLVPKSENAKFKYPPRVYLLADYETTNRTVTADDIRSTAEDLLRAGMLIDYNPEKWFDWTCFEIDVTKLPKDTEFSYDPNLYPLSIFTISAIPPEAIVASYDVPIKDFDED